MTPKESLEKAISLATGQTALANLCGERVKQSHVWNWLHRDGGRVPAEHVIGVAKAVNFKVRPHDLRPDLYPNSTDGMPPEQAAVI